MELGRFSCYSLIQLAKKGSIEIRFQSRELTSQIKKGRTQLLDQYLNPEDTKSLLEKTIDSDSTLVPIPRSAPLKEGFAWPSKNICDKLIEHGFGKETKELIKRVKSIPSSHEQDSSENRALISAHIETMIIQNIEPLFNPKKIILVDDVITQGRTSSACFHLLKKRYPKIPIIFFAPIRTISFDTVNEIFLPNRSVVKYYDTGKSFVEHNPNIFDTIGLDD